VKGKSIGNRGQRKLFLRRFLWVFAASVEMRMFQYSSVLNVDILVAQGVAMIWECVKFVQEYSFRK